MDPVSRRSFLVAGGAAAGAAVFAGPIGADSVRAAAAGSDQPVQSEPMLVFIKDAASGQVAVMAGEHEVVYTDRQLVARLQRAARIAM